MPLINNNKTKILGVDLGSAAIKIAELAVGGKKPILTTYGVAERDRTITHMSSPKNQQVIADLLREVIQKARVSATKAVAAVSAFNAFNTVIELPAMPLKEINSAIHWEAKKILPLPIDKMSLDWQIIPGVHEENDKIRIILTAAPKDVITNYLSIFKKINFNLVGVETETTALRRSLVADQQGECLVIDMGATNTNMIVFSQGLPMINRNIEVGGETITANIVNAMNVTENRATKFRNDIGLPENKQYAHPVGKAIAFVIDNMIVNETKRLISAFSGSSQKNIEKIILIGGCVYLKKLPNYLQTALQIHTVIGQPWSQIHCPLELAEEAKKIGPQMNVAVGLAMKKS